MGSRGDGGYLLKGLVMGFFRDIWYGWRDGAGHKSSCLKLSPKQRPRPRQKTNTKAPDKRPRQKTQTKNKDKRPRQKTQTKDPDKEPSLKKKRPRQKIMAKEDQDKSKKTEGLKLGAVDKLLVGIFVGCDGEEETCLSSLIPEHPIYFSYYYPITK
jgi:hypothetical protein